MVDSVLEIINQKYDLRDWKQTPPAALEGGGGRSLPTAAAGQSTSLSRAIQAGRRRNHDWVKACAVLPLTSLNFCCNAETWQGRFPPRLGEGGEAGGVRNVADCSILPKLSSQWKCMRKIIDVRLWWLTHELFQLTEREFLLRRSLKR